MNEEKVEKLVLNVLDNIKGLEILLQVVPVVLKFSVKILGYMLQESGVSLYGPVHNPM